MKWTKCCRISVLASICIMLLINYCGCHTSGYRYLIKEAQCSAEYSETSIASLYVKNSIPDTMKLYTSVSIPMVRILSALSTLNVDTLKFSSYNCLHWDSLYAKYIAIEIKDIQCGAYLQRSKSTWCNCQTISDWWLRSNCDLEAANYDLNNPVYEVAIAINVGRLLLKDRDSVIEHKVILYRKECNLNKVLVAH